MKEILFKVSFSDEFVGTQYVLAKSIREVLDITDTKYPGKDIISIECITSKILRK